MEFINTTKAPAAVGPYSQATKTGNLVLCSGQIPLIPETGELILGDITAATKRCLNNLAAVLEDAGSSLSSVVKFSIFITDMGQFATINAAYEEILGDHRPARAVVEVSGLPKGAEIEIECIAELN